MGLLPYLPMGHLPTYHVLPACLACITTYLSYLYCIIPPPGVVFFLSYLHGITMCALFSSCLLAGCVGGC